MMATRRQGGQKSCQSFVHFLTPLEFREGIGPTSANEFININGQPPPSVWHTFGEEQQRWTRGV